MAQSRWTVIGLLIVANVLLGWLTLSWPDVGERAGQVRLIVLSSLLLSQGNLAAVWAVLGGGPSAPWRLVGVLAVFSVWMCVLELDWPAGELQLVGHLLLLPQFVTTSLVLLVARWVGLGIRHPSCGERGRDSDISWRWWQFSLGSLLAGAAALALLLGLPDSFPAVDIFTPRSRIDRLEVLMQLSFAQYALLGGNATIALAAVWTALGMRRPWMRMLVLGTAAVVTCTRVLYGDYDFIPSWFVAALCLGQTLLLIGSLYMVRSAGYRLVWRRRRLCPAPCKQQRTEAK